MLREQNGIFGGVIVGVGVGDEQQSAYKLS
jgi:hypothetical protein